MGCHVLLYLPNPGIETMSPLVPELHIHSLFLGHQGKSQISDDTTQMAESEEELKIVLMKVKQESEKANLKLNLQNIGTIPTKN